MNYGQIRQRVKEAAKRAGLEKRVHLHLFRKSRATHMIQQNYQESVIKKILWGNMGTQMFRTYVVLSEADIDGEILSRAGIEKQQARPDPLAPPIGSAPGRMGFPKRSSRSPAMIHPAGSRGCCQRTT